MSLHRSVHTQTEVILNWDAVSPIALLMGRSCVALVGVSLLQGASGGRAALHRNVGWVTLNTLIRPLDFWFPACGGGGTWGRAARQTLFQQNVNLYDSQTGMNNQTLSSHETHDVSRKQETSCEFWST